MTVGKLPAYIVPTIKGCVKGSENYYPMKAPLVSFVSERVSYPAAQKGAVDF